MPSFELSPQTHWNQHISRTEDIPWRRLPSQTQNWHIDEPFLGEAMNDELAIEMASKSIFYRNTMDVIYRYICTMCIYIHYIYTIYIYIGILWTIWSYSISMLVAFLLAIAFLASLQLTLANRCLHLPPWRMVDVYPYCGWFGNPKNQLVPSGKRLHNYGKSPLGKSTISMVIFNSKLLVITRG